ncbi:hypothetical protein ACFLHK_RS17235, partial [Escherichia coli]
YILCRTNTATEKLIPEVTDLSFFVHPVDMDDFSDFRKFVFCPCAVTCFIRDAIFAGYREFSAC